MAVVEELITERIDIWTSAIKRKSSAGRGGSRKIELYGLSKLRELILDLAVRGLLVEQDPNDEPASELLARIAAKKTELTTGKKKKPLPPVEEQDHSSLPDGWNAARLGNVINVLNGRAYKKHEMLAEGTPLLRVGNLFTSNEWYYSDLELEPEKYIDNGDLIYAWSASFGPFIWDGGKVIYHYHIWKLDFYSPADVDKYYFRAYLDAISASIKASGNGIAMIHMTKERMEKLVLPIPPLAEQHRIVAKVDELMALCDQLEHQTETSIAAHQTLVETLLNAMIENAALSTVPTEGQNKDSAAQHSQFEQAWQRIAEHFDTLFTTEHSIELLKKTILQLAVMGKLVPQDPKDEPAGELLKRIAAEKAELVKAKKIKKQKALPEISEEEPFNLPNNWKWARINELLIGDTQNGLSFKANEESDGIPLLRISAATCRKDFVVDVEDHKLATNITNDQIDKYSLVQGDLLAVRFNGNKEFVGRTAIVPEIHESKIVYPDKLIRMRFSDELTNSYLIRYFINSPSVRELIEQHCATTVGNWGISAKNLKTVPVPVPPLLEQHRIVAKIDELMNMCSELKAQLAEAQSTQLQLADAVTEQAIN